MSTKRTTTTEETERAFRRAVVGIAERQIETGKDDRALVYNRKGQPVVVSVPERQAHDHNDNRPTEKTTMPTKRAARPIITTITLTLVDESGHQFPIGKNGSPTFHQFKDWTEAQSAIVDMVATIGIETVHAMAVTLTQSQDGRLAEFTATHYSRSDVAEMFERAKARCLASKGIAATASTK